MNIGEIISKVFEKDESKVMLAPLSNIAGADIKFDKGFGTLKINIPADVAYDLTNGSGKYVGGLLMIDRQVYEDAKKGGATDTIYSTVPREEVEKLRKENIELELKNQLLYDEGKNWYDEYQKIKEELKQEKKYKRASEKLADKYFVELQTAKQEVAREIFEEIESIFCEHMLGHRLTAEQYESHRVWHRFTGEQYHKYKELKKKYTEGTDGKQA